MQQLYASGKIWLLKFVKFDRIFVNTETHMSKNL